MNSRISKSDLDDDTLVKLQTDRSALVQSLSHCVHSAQELDDKVTALGVVVHADNVKSEAVDLESRAKLVSSLITINSNLAFLGV